MTLHSPDAVDGFSELRSIDKAVMLRGYLLQIEEEEKRIKSLIDDCCAKAVTQNDRVTDGWKLVVRYASGVSTRPDVSMLAATYPDKYKMLYDAQIQAFKPSFAKTDVEWLFSDLSEEDRKAVARSVMVEHMVRPQYILQKGAGE